MPLQQCAGGSDQIVDVGAIDLREQVGPGREMPVESALADSRALSDRADLDQLVTRTVDEFGRIDVPTMSKSATSSSARLGRDDRKSYLP